MCSASKIFSCLPCAFLVIALAAPALAAPVLFGGNVTLTSGYRKNFYTPSGPDPSDYGRVFTHVGAPSGLLSVMGGGSITVPSGTFTDYFTSYTTSFPAYPYFFVRNTRVQRTGTFGPGFLNTTVTLYANTTSFPNLVSDPRQGTIRLIPGTAGFGGYMGIYENVLYTGTWNRFGIGTYYFVQRMVGTPGDDPPGAVSANALYGYFSHTTLTNAFMTGPLRFTSDGPGTGVPWITGSLTVALPDGAYNTVRTVAGVDARNSVYSGKISLVSARILNVFFRIGPGVQKKHVRWGRTTRVNLVLMPEPGRLALVATGLLGCFVLARVRCSGAR